MKRILFLSLLFPISINAEVVGKDCSLTWTAVPDSRVVGYRIYLDNVRTVDAFQWTLITCATAKIPQKKEVKVHVTAITAPGANQLESKPSNVLPVFWDSTLVELASPIGLKVVPIK